MAAFTPVGVEFVARGMRDFESRINHVNDNVLELADSIDKMGKQAADTAQKDFNALVEGILDTQDAVRSMGQAMGQQAGGGGGLGALLEGAANLGSVIGGIGSVVGGAITAVVDLGAAMIGAAIDGARFLTGELLKVIGASTEMAGSFESASKLLGIAASSEIAQGVTSFEQLSEAALAVGGDTRLIGVSAMGAADAITGLYRAGLSTTDIFGDLEGYLAGDADLMGALRAAIDLAAASELDMVEASDLAAVLLSTFGQQAKESGESVDKWIVKAMNNMVQAADASVASVPDLTEALNNVGPIAASFGFELKDVNTALAILSTRGIRGAEAGTVLRSMFSTMTGGGKKAEKAMQELGISLYDQQGNMYGLSEIIEQLVGAMDGVKEVTVEVGGRTAEQNAELKRLRSMYAGVAQDLRDYELGIAGVGQSEEARQKAIEQAQIKMINLGAAISDLEAIQGVAQTSTVALTDKQTNMYAKTLAGTYGMRGLTSILAEGTKGWNDMSLAIGDAATIQEVSAKRADSLAGITEAYEGSMESLSIRIGQQFLPVATDWKRLMTDMVDTVGPKVVDMFTQLGAVVQRVTGVFFDLDWSTIVGDLLSGDFSSLVEGLSLAGLELGIPEGVIGFVTNLVEKGSELVAWLQEKVPAAIATASTYWTDTLWPAMQGVWGWVQGTAIPIIQRVYNWLQDQLPSAVQQAASFWETTLEPAIGTVVGAFENLVVFWDTHGPGIQETASNLFAKFAEITADLSANVIPWFVEQIEKVSAWYVENGPLIEQAIKTAGEAWTGLSGFVVEAWDVIEPLLSGIVDLVLDIVELGMNIAVRDWEAAWETIKETVSGVGAAINEAIDELIDLIVKALGGDSWDAVQEQWAGNWELFKTIVSTVWTNIVTAVSAWLIRAGATIKNWAVGIQVFWQNLWTGIRDWVVQAWTDIIAFFVNAWTTIKETAATLWQGIVDTVTGAVRGLFEAMGLDMGEMVTRWSAIWEDVRAIAAEIWDRISTAITERLGTMRDNAAEIWDTVSTKVSEVWDKIVTWVTERVQEVRDYVEEQIQGLADFWGPIWDEVSTKVTEVWQTIVNWVREKVEDIRSTAQEKSEETRDQISSAWDEIVTRVTEKVQEIYNNITGKIEEVKTWITDQWQSLVDLGASIVSGLVQGVLGGVGKLIDALTGGVEDAVRAIKDFLGIASPSALLAGFGEEMTAGLAQGLTEGAPDLLREQAALVSDLVEAMSDELSRASAALGSALGDTNDLLVDELAPAFELLSELLEDEALPAFEEIVDLFEGDLAESVEDFAEVLDKKLLDTAGDVLQWIRTRFIPGLKDLADVFRITLVQATYTIASVWTGTLIPALNYLAQTIESGVRVQVDLLAQAFGSLADSSQTTATAFGTLSTVVNTVTDGFVLFRGAIDNVYDQTQLFAIRIVQLAQAFERLAGAIHDTNFELLRFGVLIQGLPPELPGYLQSSSPSPFETAIRGIADAVHELAHEELPDLISVLTSPMLQGGLRATVAATVGAQATMAPVAAPAVYPNRSLNVGPVTIQNGMDEAQFMAFFRRAIRTELGGF